MTLLDEAAYAESILQLGVLRIYFTRHGAGPFVTEDGWLNDKLPEHHNVTSRWQEHFRLGWFDTVAACYALDVIEGVDGLAITQTVCP